MQSKPSLKPLKMGHRHLLCKIKKSMENIGLGFGLVVSYGISTLVI